MPIIPSYTSTRSRKYRLSVDYDAIQAKAIQSAMLVSASVCNENPNNYNKRRRSQDLAGSFKTYLQTTFSIARKKRSPSLPAICYLTQICKFLSVIFLFILFKLQETSRFWQSETIFIFDWYLNNLVLTWKNNSFPKKENFIFQINFLFFCHAFSIELTCELRQMINSDVFFIFWG